MSNSSRVTIQRGRKRLMPAGIEHMLVRLTGAAATCSHRAWSCLSPVRGLSQFKLIRLLRHWISKAFRLEATLRYLTVRCGCPVRKSFRTRSPHTRAVQLS
jgi:hypothetical protein